MSKRLARLNEQLKREITGVLRTQVRDPRLGVVTVTGVEVAGDLAVAKVWVRTLGGPEERIASLEGLEAAAPFVRRELGRMLHLRKIPELRFAEDRSMEHALRIEEILSEVEIPEDEGESDEAGEAADATDAPEDGGDPTP